MSLFQNLEPTMLLFKAGPMGDQSRNIRNFPVGSGDHVNGIVCSQREQ